MCMEEKPVFRQALNISGNHYIRTAKYRRPVAGLYLALGFDRLEGYRYLTDTLESYAALDDQYAPLNEYLFVQNIEVIRVVVAPRLATKTTHCPPGSHQQHPRAAALPFLELRTRFYHLESTASAESRPVVLDSVPRSWTNNRLACTHMSTVGSSCHDARAPLGTRCTARARRNRRAHATTREAGVVPAGYHSTLLSAAVIAGSDRHPKAHTKLVVFWGQDSRRRGITASDDGAFLQKRTCRSGAVQLDARGNVMRGDAELEDEPVRDALLGDGDEGGEGRRGRGAPGSQNVCKGEPGQGRRMGRTTIRPWLHPLALALLCHAAVPGLGSAPQPADKRVEAGTAGRVSVTVLGAGSMKDVVPVEHEKNRWEARHAVMWRGLAKHEVRHETRVGGGAAEMMTVCARCLSWDVHASAMWAGMRPWSLHGAKIARKETAWSGLGPLIRDDRNLPQRSTRVRHRAPASTSVLFRYSSTYGARTLEKGSVTTPTKLDTRSAALPG
ncbi:hypothetical protein DFH09DRAFT_1090359 [Mycena vulgaris]|nr:hypothetical protein DFH09DRAFT_1090359 [Mycena vulgaris]